MAGIPGRSFQITSQQCSGAYGENCLGVSVEKRGGELIPHPPYTPGLAPNNFFLYPTLKRSLKGWRFSSINEIETAVQGELQRISKDGFQEVFEQWQKRWDKSVCLGGEYIERVRDREE